MESASSSENADVPEPTTSNQKKLFKTKDFCVCKDLLECLREERFCDVVLIADDGKIQH